MANRIHILCYRYLNPFYWKLVLASKKLHSKWLISWAPIDFGGSCSTLVRIQKIQSMAFCSRKLLRYLKCQHCYWSIILQLLSKVSVLVSSLHHSSPLIHHRNLISPLHPPNLFIQWEHALINQMTRRNCLVCSYPCASLFSTESNLFSFLRIILCHI